MKPKSRKNFRKCANATLFIIFFLTPLKDWPWQNWFSVFASACILDSLSTMLCDYRDKDGREYESNPWFARLMQEYGSITGVVIHRLITLAYALATGYAFSLFTQFVAGLLFFILTVWEVEITISNLSLTFKKHRTRLIFSPL